MKYFLIKKVSYKKRCIIILSIRIRRSQISIIALEIICSFQQKINQTRSDFSEITAIQNFSSRLIISMSFRFSCISLMFNVIGCHLRWASSICLSIKSLFFHSFSIADPVIDNSYIFYFLFLQHSPYLSKNTFFKSRENCTCGEPAKKIYLKTTPLPVIWFPSTPQSRYHFGSRLP